MKYKKTIEIEKITFDDLDRLECLSVTDYCRALVELNDADHQLEVYRGDMKCLIIDDIRVAASVEPNITSWTKSRMPFKRLEKLVRALKSERGSEVADRV